MPLFWLAIMMPAADCPTLVMLFDRIYFFEGMGLECSPVIQELQSMQAKYQALMKAE